MNDAFSPEAHALGLREAHQLRQRLSHGDRLPGYRPPGIVLQSGETGLGEIWAEFSRYMRLEVQYPVRRAMFVMGRPAFMAGAMIAKLAFDAADRRAAARLRTLAAPQWRFMCYPRVILTDQRMIAYVPERHELASFWHGALVGFAPNLTQFSLELAYSDTDPVLLRGPMVPWMTVAFDSCIHPAS
jgi:hypothetical protein